MIASVQGSRRYTVSLNASPDALNASCTCPSFTSGPCKHIWATLLTAEERGLLDPRQIARAADPLPYQRVLPPPSAVGFDPGHDDDDELDDLDDVDREELEAALDAGDEDDLDEDGELDDGADPGDFDDRRPRPGFTAPAWSPQRAFEQRDLWRQRLETAAQAAAFEPASEPFVGQIIYIVDMPGTQVAGVLHIEIARRRPMKKGGWSAPIALRLRPGAIPRLPDPADRELLALLLGAQPATPYSAYGGYSAPTPTLYRLRNGLDELLLPRLCATGRCLVRHDRRAPLSDLAWDDGAPWEFWLEMKQDGQDYVVEGDLRRDGVKRPLSDPQLLVDRLVFFDDVAARFDHRRSFPFVSDLRRHGALKVPKAHATLAVERLLLKRERPRLTLQGELSLDETPGVPAPHLVLKASPHQWSDRLRCALSFDYDGTRVAASSDTWCVARVDERRLVVRDQALEEAAIERLRPLGFRWIGANPGGSRGQLELSPRHLAPAVRALLAEGWRVEADGKLYRKAGAVRMEVVSGIDWFDLKGDVSFEDTQVPLPAVLAALRRGESTIALGDGTVGMLPEEWLARYGLMASLGSPEPDALRFRRSQAGLLDALLATQPAVSFDATFEAARRALREFDGVRPAEQPAAFNGQLRAYQRQGLGWLHFLARFGFGGCLADDMGLGKTIQVLALLEARRSTAGAAQRLPSLIVVPRSLVFNWKDEAARFVPDLRILDHAGAERAKSADSFDGHDVVLTTYGTLRRDILLLKEAAFDYVVLDEAQAIKNASTESAKAVRLLNGRHRLALSGTPIENHVGELWSLFEFLNPGMLGRSEPFRKSARTGLDEAERSLLARALRPLILRRTKGEVARDLPPKVEQTVHCELDVQQRKVYDELRRHYRGSLLARIDKEGMARSKIHVLEALLRLRQAACHPGLINPKHTGEPCAKIDVLLPRLEEVREEGHKALVFSQFTSFLSILRTQLDERKLSYEYLDGRTRDRAERVRRFQEQGDCGVFLISLKAGGLGLNLTAAEYVFLLDPWWNPAVEAQAIDRTHRIGQSRHVFAYRLIAKDTVEEKVLELQEHKRGLADALLGGDKSLIGELRREDLELLLS